MPVPSRNVLRVNTTIVASQTIDEESVIINFTSGMYYSTDATGAVIWALLEEGTSLDAIVAYLAGRTTGAFAEISEAVAAFLEELRAEELIVEVAGTVSPPADALPTPTDARAFTAPTLDRFTDMADILLLDPVHEIEDRRQTI